MLGSVGLSWVFLVDVFLPASLVSVPCCDGQKKKNGTHFWKVQSNIASKYEVWEIKSENNFNKARTAPLTEIEIKFLRHLVEE